MSLGANIEIDDRALQKTIKKMPLAGASLNSVVGRSAANMVKDHLRDLDNKRANSLGGERSHFYAEAADATYFDTITDGVAVNIAKEGMAQRYYGGEITPVNSKALAIPARAEAHGRSPREPEIPDLNVMFFQGKKAIGALIDGNDDVWFWLCKSVTQEPDKSVLPEPDALLDQVQDDLEAYIEMRLEQAKNG